ncbi:TetR/AcrR family transcriptional regulator [Bradyrhizobium sp. HKCCYLS2038]|uniref:TetR/AcrR family transcriptional regulator n=1 Tax=unclassified Bradyrhizobium TaxID=2631580 RepID=UPI003EBB47F8
MAGRITVRKAKPATPPEPGTHAERRDEAERRLLAAAAEIIAERGVEGMTLADVGIAAGYSRGLPAHYYGNKNGLLEAVAGYIAEGFANRLDQGGRFEPGLPTLLGAVESYLTATPRSRKNTVTLQSLIAESLTEQALRGAVSQVNDRSLQRLAAMIRTGIDRGEVRPDVNPDREAVIILGALRALIAMWLIDPRDVNLEVVRKAFAGSVRRALTL